MDKPMTGLFPSDNVWLSESTRRRSIWVKRVMGTGTTRRSWIIHHPKEGHLSSTCNDRGTACADFSKSGVVSVDSEVVDVGGELEWGGISVLERESLPINKIFAAGDIFSTSPTAQPEKAKAFQAVNI